MQTEQTNPDPSDGLDGFAAFMNGSTQAEDAPPNFDGMKKGDLQKWVQEQVEAGKIPADDGTALILQKLKDLRASLKAMFPAPDDLTAPEVTGFDPNDFIHQVVAEVGSIETDEEAAKQIHVLQDDAEFNFFKIGGVLAKIRAEGWLYEYETFGDLVEGEFSIKKRKAESLMQIYHALVGCGAPWDEAKQIGWSKLVVIAPVLSPENYKEWFSTALESTQATLVQIVKDAKAAGSTATPSNSMESNPISKKTFSLHSDQLETINDALDKAKKISGTEHENQALDIIAQEYLAGGNTPAPAPSAQVAAKSADEVEPTAEEEEVDAEETLTSLFQAIADEESLTLAQKLKLIATCFEDVFPMVEIEFSIEDGLDTEVDADED